MKIVYAVSGLLVLSVAVLVLMGPGPGYAQCAPQGVKNCTWLTLPTATQAVDGVFDTATDGDPNELTVDWNWDSIPIGGTVEFVDVESVNIRPSDPEVEYTPSQFEAQTCTGRASVTVRGELVFPNTDGTLVTRVFMGAAPGCGQEVDKEPAIDAQ